MKGFCFHEKIQHIFECEITNLNIVGNYFGPLQVIIFMMSLS